MPISGVRNCAAASWGTRTASGEDQTSRLWARLIAALMTFGRQNRRLPVGSMNSRSFVEPMKTHWRGQSLVIRS